MYTLFEHVVVCAHFWKTAPWSDMFYNGGKEAKGI